MKKLILAAIIAASLTAVGCNKKVPQLPDIDQSIAVILRSPTDTTGLQIAQGILGAAMKYNVTPIIFTADSLTDFAGQINIINNLNLDNYIGVIIIAAADNGEMIQAIGGLSQQIPVVLAHTNLSGDLPVISFVGTDNIAAGEELAVAANQVLGAKDTVSVIEVGSSAIISSRMFGFSQRIENLGHATVINKYESTTDLDYYLELLIEESHPEITAIVTTDAASAIIVAATLRKIGRTEIKLFTFDVRQSIVGAINDGSITGSLASDTYSTGYSATLAIINTFMGISASRTQYQPIMYIDKSNISTAAAAIYLNNL